MRLNAWFKCHLAVLKNGQILEKDTENFVSNHVDLIDVSLYF